MEKSELIELVEGPVLKYYGNLLTKKNDKLDDVSAEKADIKTTTISSSSTASTSKYSVPLSEAQRDRRTVFLQQLSVRCTDRDISEFFASNSCPCRNARIVLDKYTRKSKGVAYVEFYEEETVRVALKLTGKKLLGVPIIIELTETEKNRIAQEAASLNSSSSSRPSSNANASTTSTTTTSSSTDSFVKLYIGSLHSSLTELELERLFEPFGALESVELLKEETTGQSKGVAFIEFKKSSAARSALEALNGFELAGRAIRVGPVRTADAKTKTSGSNLLPSQQHRQQQHQQHKSSNVEVDEEEHLSLDPRKRAELMQKLLSSRK
jgi:RNA-binding protein 23/39